LRSRVFEVHPEVSFAYWNNGPLESKRSEQGLARRRALVSAYFGEIPVAPRGAREDDLLDAFAALWTAERIVGARHQTLGDARPDLTGLPMRIVY
jgi:predicted RNase H-like nuclease